MVPSIALCAASLARAMPLAGLLRQGLRGLASTSASAGAQSALKRDPSYSLLSPDDVVAFRQMLGDRGVLQDDTTLDAANRDWMGKYVGGSRLALRPTCSAQVSQLLAHCSLRRLAVVPQGGNTGLVGGSTPVFDEIVLSTAGLNRVLSFDETSGVLVAQAGCVLQTLEEYVSERGYTMPLDLGAKGSCHIGGNVSTNAGGLRLLRYGSLHGSVLGLEVVLPDGTVLDLLRTLRKDNTGYDLKQLFIGAEGSLGVVTAVAIQCAPLPASVQLALLACPSFDAVQAVLRRAKRGLGEILAAVEFLDDASMHLVTNHLEGVIHPLARDGSSGVSPFYMVVETHGSNARHDQEKMEEFLEGVMTDGIVTDGALADNHAQAAAIWRVREGITESLVRHGVTYKYDVSLPTGRMYELVEDVRARTRHIAGVVTVGYGHVGDGNLHLNVSCASGHSDELLDILEPHVYEWTSRVNGSISAEHGIGRMKASALRYSKPREAVELMARLKHLFDPHAVLNPYKILPPPQP